MLTVSLIIITTLIIIFLEYARRKHSYWRYRGIFSPPAKFIFGHAGAFTSKKQQIWMYFDEYYHQHKSKGFFGLYTMLTPVLVVLDPKHIREILTNAFDHFPSRGQTFSSNSDSDRVVDDMLNNLSGRRWKYVRSKISPSFTSGKLKGMFHLISKTGDDLIDLCNSKVKEGGIIDIANAMNRYVADVIANVAAGIEGGCLKDENSMFYKSLPLNAFKRRGLLMLKFFVFTVSPSLFRFLGLSMIPKEGFKFAGDLKKTIEDRIKSGKKRGDFIDLMIDAMESAKNSADDPELVFPIETTVAQVMVFIFAGFTTTSTSLTFMLYLLAKNQDEQNKLREEIITNMKDEKYTYPNVMEAPYLDACLNECQRLYPIAIMGRRYCENSYHFSESSVIVQRGFNVFIPTYSLHHDPAYWKEPEKFMPSRFLPENKADIVPYTFMPFGGGPRICVGQRFALMEMKIAITKLLLNYKIELEPGYEMKLIEEEASKMEIAKLNVMLREIK